MTILCILVDGRIVENVGGRVLYIGQKVFIRRVIITWKTTTTNDTNANVNQTALPKICLHLIEDENNNNNGVAWHEGNRQIGYNDDRKRRISSENRQHHQTDESEVINA